MVKFYRECLISIQVMLFITIIILIVAKALPVLNTQITSSQFFRLTSISLIFAGLQVKQILYGADVGKSTKILYVSRSHPYFSSHKRWEGKNTTVRYRVKTRSEIIKKNQINGFIDYYPNFLSYCFIIVGSIVLPALATLLIFYIYSMYSGTGALEINYLPDLLQNSICFINDNFFYRVPVPFILCVALFILVLKKYKIQLDKIEILIFLILFYQIAILIDILINGFINYYSNIELTLKTADNNIPNNITRNSNHSDYPWIIKYIAANIAALAAKKPVGRAICLALTNTGNLVTDMLSNEQRANYWIEQYKIYKANGRFIGGQPGTGPFKIVSNPVNNLESSSSATINSNPVGNSDISSNFLPDFDFLKLVFDFISPVEHSIPLSTLINVHFLSHLCLFVMVFCLMFLYIFVCFNILILFNKDYLLNKVKNRYALMYVKYVLFKSRVDIVVLSIIIISSHCTILYCLHYLIVHPIIINT